MCICSEAFYKHWILFPTVWHLSRLSQGRTQGKQNVLKNAHSRGLLQINHSPPIYRYISEMVKDGYMQRGVWQALNPLSIHVTFTATVPGEAKMCKKCAKMENFLNYGWITRKRLKIDGYMLRCVWQALNPLFIHVTQRLSHGRIQGGQNVS